MFNELVAAPASTETRRPTGGGTLVDDAAAEYSARPAKQAAPLTHAGTSHERW